MQNRGEFIRSEDGGVILKPRDASKVRHRTVTKARPSNTSCNECLRRRKKR